MPQIYAAEAWRKIVAAAATHFQCALLDIWLICSWIQHLIWEGLRVESQWGFYGMRAGWVVISWLWKERIHGCQGLFWFAAIYGFSKVLNLVPSIHGFGEEGINNLVWMSGIETIGRERWAAHTEMHERDIERGAKGQSLSDYVGKGDWYCNS